MVARQPRASSWLFARLRARSASPLDEVVATDVGFVDVVGGRCQARVAMHDFSAVTARVAPGWQRGDVIDDGSELRDALGRTAYNWADLVGTHSGTHSAEPLRLGKQTLRQLSYSRSAYAHLQRLPAGAAHSSGLWKDAQRSYSG